MSHRGFPHPRRGRARPPSIPVATPGDEVMEIEREIDVRRLQVETASSVYARTSTRF